MLAGAGRFEEALRWAEETKRFDPEMETSSWTLWYLLKHRIEGGSASLEEMRAFEQQHPDARQPGFTASKRLGVYLSFLPEPAEATINVLRQIQARDNLEVRGGSVGIKLSCLESPSSRMAVEQSLERMGIRPDLSVEHVPSPDPRRARGDVDWLLWQYEGTTPKPGLPVPSSTVVSVVERLAGQVYDLQDWKDLAKESAGQLAAEFGDTPESLYDLAGDLLAVMVYPPCEPDGQSSWGWIQRVQIAAALIVANLDRGWEKSVRRLALQSLIRGPVDWSTEAGILALSQLDTEPDTSEAARREIQSLYRELVENLPDTGYCCYLYMLAWAISQIPEERRGPSEDFAPLWDRLREGS